MKLRKLAWLCPHEEIKAHDVIFNSLGESYPCPGGVFLPDDTLIIEKKNGEWPDAVGRDSLTESVRYERVRLPIDALSVRDADLEGVQE